jgi:hypothetical protein
MHDDQCLRTSVFDVSVHVISALFRFGPKRGWHLSVEYLVMANTPTSRPRYNLCSVHSYHFFFLLSCMPKISFAGSKKRKVRHSGRVYRMSLEGTDEVHPAISESSLALLADELLLNVIEYLDSHAALCNLAATCRRFQGLTEPYIWRSLLVLNGTHALNIAAALDGQDDRIEAIQEISIRYKNEYREGIESLNYYLGMMGRLRHLTLESPCPNNSEWRPGTFFDGWSRIDYSNLIASAIYPREGLTPALPMLQSSEYIEHS